MIVKSRRAVPETVKGYFLDDVKLSVIVPIERMNLISNPSFETNTIGYTAVDGAILTRTTEDQRRGTRALKVKPGLSSVSSLYYTSPSLTSNNTYAFSLDVNIRGGRKYQIRVSDNARSLVTKKVIGKGFWERISVVFTTVTTGAHRLYFEKDSNSSTDVFFTDGWQLELCEAGNYWPTTYIDGDQSGFVVNQIPPPYLWTGTPHASTSTRSGATRAGGRVLDLRSDLGFEVNSIIGLGMEAVTNIATPNALIGGAFYQRTTPQSRRFTIVGSLFGATVNELKRNRRLLSDTLNPGAIGLQQPLVLRCQIEDHEIVNIVCNYASGLEGMFDNFHQEKLAIQFSAFNPFFLQEEGEVASSLSFIKSIIGAFTMQRLGNGTWTNVIGSGTNGNILAITPGNDGYVYFGGTFTSAGGLPAGTANKIVKYQIDGETFTAFQRMGSYIGATGGDVRAIAIGHDGRIYAAGSFTGMDGVANTNGIAVYDLATNTWSAVGTGLSGGSGWSLAVGLDGSIYVGGDFTGAGGVANTARIARWTPATSNWNACSLGITDLLCQALVTMLDGTIIAGGTFNSVVGVAATSRIARYHPDTNTWSSISSAVTSSIFALAVAPDGTLYAGGDYSSIGGVSANYIAKFNGVSWTPLGSGISGGSAIRAIVIDGYGNVIVSGDFTGAGDLSSLIDSVAVWNGSSWVYLAINVAAGSLADTTPGAVARDGTLYMRPNFSGTNTAESITTVPNNGEAAAYPIIVFTGAGRIIQLSNWTTGDFVYFDLTLADGERAILTLQPGNISFVSNNRGNLMSTILPGSSLATFKLQPGDNRIGCFAVDAGANFSVAMRRKNQHLGLEGSIRGG